MVEWSGKETDSSDDVSSSTSAPALATVGSSFRNIILAKKSSAGLNFAVVTKVSCVRTNIMFCALSNDKLSGVLSERTEECIELRGEIERESYFVYCAAHNNDAS